MEDDTTSWSRAMMSSTGLSLGRGAQAQRETRPELKEALEPDLNRERLRELAASRTTEVREAVALRADCPLGVLAALAHDDKAQVRAAAAANPRVARAIVEVLMQDKDASVVKAIVRNDSTPEDVISQLASHRRPEVRRAAARRLGGVTAARGRESGADAQHHARSLPRPAEVATATRDPAPGEGGSGEAGSRFFMPVTG